jgi:hypothetical protein
MMVEPGGCEDMEILPVERWIFFFASSRLRVSRK